MDRFEALKSKLETFVSDRDWQQFHSPKNMATCIAVEAGELLEHYTWLKDGFESGPDSAEAPDKSVVSAEAADVFLSLLSFCRVLDIDLLSVTEAKLASLSKRYPVETAKGSAAKAPMSDDRG